MSAVRYDYNQHVNYFYRLWRQRSGSGGGGGCRYWTPRMESLDNTAYPAYHFYFSNNIILSADAYSGAVLGISG